MEEMANQVEKSKKENTRKEGRKREIHCTLRKKMNINSHDVCVCVNCAGDRREK